MVRKMNFNSLLVQFYLIKNFAVRAIGGDLVLAPCTKVR